MSAVTAARRTLQSGLLGAYDLARRTGAFERPAVQRLYSRVYFVYKRRLEARANAALLAWIAPGSTVIDVGANIGFFTVAFARRVGSEGHVIAFEPDGRNVTTLRWNLDRAGIANVVVVEAALADCSGPGTLYLNPSHPADHRIFAGGETRPHEAVPLVTLDEYLAASPVVAPISLIKIDIQGAEMKALRGMTKTLARVPDATLLVEYTPGALRDAGDSPEALLDFFRSRHYRPYTFAERSRRFEPVTYEALAAARATDDYFDVLFTRAEEPAR